MAGTSSYKREEGMHEWGRNPTAREPETCAGAQKTQIATNRRETDKRACRQGRREGNEHPRTGSPALTLKHPSPFSDSGFQGADSREFPRAEQSKFSVTASAGPRATLKYSEEGGPTVRRF